MPRLIGQRVPTVINHATLLRRKGIKMQETKYQDKEMLKHYQEFFCGKDSDDLTQKMDSRLSELEARGHELVRRVELDDPTVKSISRNAPCPCGSGHKYKRCCLKVR
jgi:uncharacterized protein YecA (UPF0149 family)